jgi:predicted RNase H-related nuclease YkuK (DUF458 family)
MFKNKFKRFDGFIIDNIVEYLKNYIDNNPGVTITIGCDSTQKRRKTIYAITIMLYNVDIKNGAHVVFFRESHDKIRDNQERLYKEAQYLYEIGMYIDRELSEFYKRLDLNQIERKRYKYHLLKCSGKYSNIDLHREMGIINNLILAPEDMVDFKLVDIHIDFNPTAGNINERGISKNKSYFAYKSYVPWLRSMGFRTWAKNQAHAASTAADLLLKD